MPARTSEKAPEADRIGEFPHPRETRDLIGHDAALARAARSIRKGRPPQAWLIAGPPGIGKATLAYRIARYLLRYGADSSGPGDLSIPAGDPVAAQIAADAHPGLLVLRRATNPRTGKLMNVLSVEEIRQLSSFFGLTAGAGGWRVAIIDTADDMNDAAANALLKTLEEPPANAMLLLVSNNPGRLPTTIRSRCQRMELRPLPDALVTEALERLLPEQEAEARDALVRLAGGSIGAALELATGEGQRLAEEADRLIDGADLPDPVRLLSLGDRLARMADGLEDFGGFLAERLAARIRSRALDGATGMRAWIDASDEIARKFSRSAALYMEPRQTVISAAMVLGDAQKRAGRL